MKRIVVGIDGSEAAKEALLWAVDEAKLRVAAVDAVHSWQYPTPAMMFEGVVPVHIDIDFAAEAKQFTDRIVKEALDGRDDVVVRALTPQGPAAQVLIEASKDAELLVVGSRGHGGFAGLMLGSVSQQVAHHAGCPVVIIRP
ncbi:MAG: universal stress protein [Actinomycetota bacterium]